MTLRAIVRISARRGRVSRKPVIPMRWSRPGKTESRMKTKAYPAVF